jgi:hypothetical protein
MIMPNFKTLSLYLAIGVPKYFYNYRHAVKDLNPRFYNVITTGHVLLKIKVNR